VPTKRATNAVHFVGCHRFPVAGAAKDNSAIAFAARDRFRRWTNEQRIIYRLLVKRAKVLHFVPERRKQGFHFLLALKPGVIGPERNFHFCFVKPVSPCLSMSIL